jgi:histidinol-phosphate aminotransferase
MNQIANTSQCAITPASRFAGLAPYQPPEYDLEIDLHLDANEGPIQLENKPDHRSHIDFNRIRKYPNAGGLESEIADSFGIQSSRVVLTNGGDDAIDRVCRVVIEPGRAALLHIPTFVMIARAVQLAGGDAKSIQWLEGEFPVDDFVSLIDETVSLVSLVTPNNPTGCVIELESILRVIKKAEMVGALVMIDLAYIEFADIDITQSLLSFDNVVLIRTFSKAYSLAGLRVGYAIGSEETSTWLRSVGSPFPVSSLSLDIASEMFNQRNLVNKSVERIKANRTLLQQSIEKLGGKCMSSQGNFLLCKFSDTVFVNRALNSLGIGVRSYRSGQVLEDYLRITIPGDSDELNRLTRALESSIKPEAILFDLDGVIADVSKSYHDSIIATAEHFGVEVDSSAIASIKQRGDANNDWVVTQRLMNQAGVDINLEQVTERFQLFYLGKSNDPGFRERESNLAEPGMFSRLKEKFKLGIVTGRPRHEAMWFLDRFEIRDDFESIVCMEDAPLKPAPDPVIKAMSQLNVERAWMVGDTPDDMVSARGAGVIAVGCIAPGHNTESNKLALVSSGASTILESVNQIEEKLK